MPVKAAYLFFGILQEFQWRWSVSVTHTDMGLFFLFSVLS
jgi:hypothetical protein